MAATLFASCFVAAPGLSAETLKGKVTAATKDTAGIVVDGDLLPSVGDKVEIFFKMPDADDEISVANGHVYEITGANIMVEVDEATGKVSKDQLVRIHSENPTKREGGIAPSNPEATPAASPEAASTAEETAPPPARTLPPSIPFPAANPKAVSPPSAGDAEAYDPAAVEFLNKGIAQYSAGDINGSIASYTSGIRAAPNMAVLYLNRANAYLFSPNFQNAISDANKALELKVEAPDDAYVIRGSARAGLGDYRAALADCNRALKINPRHALAYNNRANDKLRLRDYAGALADCNKSIALDPNSALPYYNRGFAYLDLGNYRAALADWKRAVQMQPAFSADLGPRIQQLEARGIRRD